MTLKLVGSITTLILLYAATAYATARETAREMARDTAEGCPEGSYQIQTSVDRSQLRVWYFGLGVGDGDETSRTCRLALRMDVPAGWSMGIEGVSMEAAASLAGEQDAATIEVGYELDDVRGSTALMNRVVRGPYEGGLELPGQIARGTVRWTPCGRAGGDEGRGIEIVTTVGTLSATHGTALVRGREQDEAVLQELKLAWRRCVEVEDVMNDAQ